MIMDTGRLHYITIPVSSQNLKPHRGKLLLLSSRINSSVVRRFICVNLIMIIFSHVSHIYSDVQDSQSATRSVRVLDLYGCMMFSAWATKTRWVPARMTAGALTTADTTRTFQSPATRVPLVSQNELRLSVISVGVVLVVKLTRKVKALFRNCGRSHDAYSGLAIRNL